MKLVEIIEGVTKFPTSDASKRRLNNKKVSANAKGEYSQEEMNNKARSAIRSAKQEMSKRHKDDEMDAEDVLQWMWPKFQGDDEEKIKVFNVAADILYKEMK